MKPEKRTLIVPILLITLGFGWLLTTLAVAPGINWVWTLGLASVGLPTIALGGIDKATVVVGPFFIISSTLSILRQTGQLPLDVEVPILVIVTGILLLVARLPAVSVPEWIIQETKTPARD